MALEDGPVPRTPSPEALAQLASPSGFLEVVRGALDGSLPPLPPLRGLLWRVCLGVLPSPVGSRAASPAAVVASWRTDVRQKRAAYEHLKAEFTAAPAGDGDPLADNTEWTAYFASRSLCTCVVCCVSCVVSRMSRLLDGGGSSLAAAASPRRPGAAVPSFLLPPCGTCSVQAVLIGSLRIVVSRVVGQ